MDQTLTSRSAEEMVCVCKDPFEIKLSITYGDSNSRLPCLTDSSSCSCIAVWSRVLATPLQLIYHLHF